MITTAAHIFHWIIGRGFSRFSEVKLTLFQDLITVNMIIRFERRDSLDAEIIWLLRRIRQGFFAPNKNLRQAQLVLVSLL